MFAALMLVVPFLIYVSNIKKNYVLGREILPFGESLPQDSMTIMENDACVTEACTKAAYTVLQNMDITADACKDFYQFACGGFKKRMPMRDDMVFVSQFSNTTNVIEMQLWSLMSEKMNDNDPYPLMMTKMLYKSCADTKRVHELGLTEIKEIIADMGGWPVVFGDSWDSAGFNWMSAVYKFRSIGYSVDWFLHFSVGVDERHSTTRLIVIDQANLGMPRDFLVKGIENEHVQAYYNYMVAVGVHFGAEEETAKKELKESLLFEIQLAECSLAKEERRNMSKLYNRMTVKELYKFEPGIPWLEYINRLLHPFYIITDSESVIVDVPSYITKFSRLMKKTDKRVMCNYAMWRLLSSSVSYLTEELRNLQQQYIKAIYGRDVRPPRWRECVAMVSNSLPNLTGSLYVRRFFNKNAKPVAEEMVSDIKNAFDGILNKITWMDPVTKDRAKEKLKNIAAHVAYPEELLYDEQLRNLYDKLYLNESHYLKSMLNLTLFETNFSFRKLREPVDKKDWVVHGKAAVTNAFYNNVENSVIIPAGILQGVFFDHKRPKYMNYGAIGTIIGHEITHGFDDKGRQFDEEGNLFNWWKPTTNTEFHKRAQCIIAQYGNYTMREIGMNVNGYSTEGENIADNGGIKETYRAYQSWLSRNKKEKRLPGLSYSPNQLFWLSTANVWCVKYRKKALMNKVLTDQHPPSWFRVNGPFSNSLDFARDWQCPLGSPMNPKHKCMVW